MIDSIAASSRAGRPIAGQPRARDLQFFRSNGRCNQDGLQDDRRVGKKIALTHHERWDGTGYPSGLSGSAIPVVGRMARASRLRS
jgi:response regulator RpfG family c-di-GMP phosphodiesterase